MKNNITYCLSAISFLLSYSCNQKEQSQKVEVSVTELRKTGAEISTIAQAALIRHLSEAIENNGTIEAISVCNYKALEISDSISNLYDCRVSRISDRNRNPKNTFSDSTDFNAWFAFQSSDDGKVIEDTLLEQSENFVYYRPIKIGMPLCLNCHGTPGTEINSETLIRIDSLYPNDLARNYKAGDLRGMWKIEFSKNNFSLE